MANVNSKSHCQINKRTKAISANHVTGEINETVVVVTLI